MSYYGAGRSGWGQGNGTDGFGADFKEKVTKPGPWHVSMGIQGETLPKFSNHLRLSRDQKDPFGIPQLITAIDYDDNDAKQTRDFLTQAVEMLEKGGCKNVYTYNSKQNPGLDIHEMGGCRMGKDPNTSLLNKWNQVHAARNVFVTDGACMTTTGNQNPSITFMALAARAANYAVAELKKGNL